MTILVVAFAAYSRIQARLRPKDIFSVIIAAFDAFSDFAFTVQQLQTMRSEFECAMGYLALAFLVVPTACSACQIVRALRSPLLDIHRLKERVPLYGFVILVALTNMEAMRVLPWRADAGDFDGLPERQMMLQMWLTVMFLEDIPQFCIQLIVITNSDGRGLLRFIAWVSLGFTFIAFVWRGICKAACQKAPCRTRRHLATLPMMPHLLLYIPQASPSICSMMPVMGRVMRRISSSQCPSTLLTPPSSRQLMSR